jgi:ATP-dependent Lon protease
MSYINHAGENIVVYCPESKYSEATQNPRKNANVEILKATADNDAVISAKSDRNAIEGTVGPTIPVTQPNEPQEKTIDVQYGDTGYGYEELFADYLKGASVVMLEEPYLSNGYQMTDLIRFVELLVKIGDCKVFKLITKLGDSPDSSLMIKNNLKKLNETLEDIESTTLKFEYEFDENSHDRYIRTSNNWDITLGRGLHFYQNMNPNKEEKNYYQMGTYDLSLRPCLKARFTFMKRNAQQY